uniref:Putative anti-proliferation factor btg1/tob n=1 Tax=Corethrella appendiculata TaxID=1370023 RepID=U5ERB9_9DIPT
MRIEINSAADFLMNLLRVKQANPLSESQLQHFKGSVEDVLLRKYRSHWYPSKPAKGSGFRCIRINGKMDPIIEKAGVAVGLNALILRKMLPQELTLWIDPDEVSYRIGENGSICVLYDQAQSRASPSSDLDSTGSSNGLACDDNFIDRRLDVSTESSLMDEFFENSAATLVVTSNKHQQQQQQHHYQKNSSSYYHHNHSYSSSKRHNNSMSSTSSGQLSPPLSPYNNGHNNKYHYQQQQQHYSTSQHQHHQQQYFHWDNNNQFVNNNKVRTQC